MPEEAGGRGAEWVLGRSAAAAAAAATRGRRCGAVEGKGEQEGVRCGGGSGCPLPCQLPRRPLCAASRPRAEAAIGRAEAGGGTHTPMSEADASSKHLKHRGAPCDARATSPRPSREHTPRAISPAHQLPRG